MTEYNHKTCYGISMTRTIHPLIFHIDTFTEKPFSGNPAAVCILPSARHEHWMQQMAREMNLPETAFLHMQEDRFNLRWFTPLAEVDLCGHGTLASAHALWEEEYIEPDAEVRFHTLSGVLTAKRVGSLIELNFPAEPEDEAVPPQQLFEALGAAQGYVGKNRLDYLVELDSEKTVRELKPDFSLLREIPCRGVIVTARAASGGYDFVSRFFAPRLGVDEDPVTGSAHCCLGPFWKKRLGKDEFKAFQVSSRGGVVHVRLSGKRVYLSGQAVTVMRGEMRWDDEKEFI